MLSIPRLTDRRAFYRHPSSSNVICRPGTWLMSPDSWSGDVLDVSYNGLSLCLYRRFEPGTPLLLEVGNGSELLTTTLARVVRVKAFCGRWLLGCKLATKLAHEDLEALLDFSGQIPSPRLS